MNKLTLERLHNRLFRDESHLYEFLESLNDESWKNELKEYYGLDDEEIEDSDASDEPLINEESGEEEINEITDEEIINNSEEVIEEPVEEIVNDEKTNDDTEFTEEENNDNDSDEEEE